MADARADGSSARDARVHSPEHRPGSRSVKQLMDATARAQEIMKTLVPANPAEEGLGEVTDRAIKFTRQNLDAAFSRWHELAKAKDLTEILQIQTRHAQLQMRASLLQAQELGTLITAPIQKAEPAAKDYFAGQEQRRWRKIAPSIAIAKEQRRRSRLRPAQPHAHMCPPCLLMIRWTVAEPDACAGKLADIMKPLKRAEEVPCVSHIEPDHYREHKAPFVHRWARPRIRSAPPAEMP